MFKPPYGRITAIDMNTGEQLWWIPNGDTPERIENHPRLRGLDLPNTGQPSHATAVVTRSLLMYGEGRAGEPRFHAVDKRTGERVGTIDLPATNRYCADDVPARGPPVRGDGGLRVPSFRGSLVALRLPVIGISRPE